MARGAHRPSRRDVVINAALGEIVERGYATVSVPSIARRAGMSISSVYYHFSSKEDIVLALMDGICEELFELAERSASPAAMLHNYLDWMRANPLRARLYHVSAVGASVALEAHRRSGQTQLVEVIAEGVLAPHQDAVSPAELTMTAIAIVMLFGELTRAVSDGRLADAEVAPRAEALLAGLLSFG